MKAKTTAGTTRAKSPKKKAEQVVTAPAPVLTDTKTSIVDKPLLIAIAVVVVVAAIVYANSLTNGFVFDDHYHVLENPLLRSLRNLPQIMRDYRPLRDVSYALDFAIWGEGPFGFHFTNVVLHLVNVGLVLYLVRRMADRLDVAIIAAAIFAVHPIQTDAATYISGRRDVLFTAFYLLSFISYLNFHESKRKTHLGLFFVFWILSLLSKEMAASLPILIFAWSFCQSWEKGEKGEKGEAGRVSRLWRAVGRALRKDIWLYISLTLLTIPYIFYQVFMKGGSERAGYKGFEYWGGSFYTNALTEIHVQGWLLKQLVFPTPIAQYQGAFKVSTNPWDWRVLVSLMVIVVLLASAFLLLNRARLVSFAIFSYFVLLLPVSQIIPHHELVADHYLYLPMMSFGLLVGLGAAKLAQMGETPRRFAYAAIGLAVIACGILTVKRNEVWKDDYTFWKTNYEAVPNSPRAAYSLGVQYMTLNPKKAVEIFKKSLALDPTNTPVYTDLAMLVNNDEEAREVEALINKGLAEPDRSIRSVEYQDPGVYRALLTAALGIVKSAEGERAEAEQLFWKACSIHPALPQVYELLYASYSKDPDRQMKVLKQELRFLPGNEDALKRMIFMLIKDQKYDEAVPYIQRILRLNPNDVFANYQMGRISLTRGDCAQARVYLTGAAARATSPDDVSATKSAMQQLSRQCGQ